MTRFISVLFLTGVLLTGCGKQSKPVIPPHITLTGESDQQYGSYYAVVRQLDQEVYYDTITIREGEFIFHTASDTMLQFNLCYDGWDKSFPLYLQKSDSVSIRVQPDSVHPVLVHGDSVNTLVLGFNRKNEPSLRRMESLQMGLEDENTKSAIDSIRNELLPAVETFCRSHSSNPASAIVVKDYLPLFATRSEVDTLLAVLTPTAKPGLILEQINDYMNVADTLRINSKLPLVSFRKEDGKRTSLHETINSYTLISFWAGWDKQSVERVKSAMKIKEKMKDRPFEIVNISLDDNDSIWQKRIKENHITGRNYRLPLGFSDEISRKLGVYTLPQNILTDTLMVVVKKDFFGPELNRYLEQNVPLKKKAKK